MKQKTPTVLLFKGSQHSGKTILCGLFLRMLGHLPMLGVDATAQGDLIRLFGMQPEQTVQTFLSRCPQQWPLPQQSVDWLLNDLPQPLPQQAEHELLRWDLQNLGFELNAQHQAALQYGLPRLLSQYALTVWDGTIQGIPPGLHNSIDWSTILVVTPDDERYCQSLANVEHAMVILSQADSTQTLPPSAAAWVQKGQCKYIGKVPSIPKTALQSPNAWPKDWLDCFYKLDLPLALLPHTRP